MYIDQNLRIRTITELTATPSRTMPWKSVKLTRENVLYVLCDAKYGSLNSSEIDSSLGHRDKTSKRGSRVHLEAIAHAAHLELRASRTGVTKLLLRGLLAGDRDVLNNLAILRKIAKINLKLANIISCTTLCGSAIAKFNIRMIDSQI